MFATSPVGVSNSGATSPAQPAHQTGKVTSYNAKGLLPNDAPDTSPEQGSARPITIQELVPQLASPYQRTLTYAQMMNDAGCDVSMRVSKSPVLGADFYIEPASSQPVDIDIAEFISDNLMGGMNAPFLNSLEDILHFFEDGYSVLEKVFETRSWAPGGTGRNSKNYTMLKTLAVRPTNTLNGVEYDNNGHLAQVNQQAIQGDNTTKAVQLKTNKVLIFTFNRQGGDLTGKSLLRTAYPHWYYKTHFYKIDAIQKERQSLGVPRGKLGPGYTQADKIALRTMLRNLRANEESFIIETPAFTVDFAETQSTLVNVLESASHHNDMILLNALAQFLSLGLSSSRNTAATASDVMMKALRFVANLICDIINMYLIPELVVWNFPTTNFPKLKVRNIGETKDLQALAAGFANLLSQDGITMDTATEQWFRQVFDMPAKQTNADGSPIQDPAYIKTPTSAPAIPDNANSKGGVSTERPVDGAGNTGKSPNSSS